MKKYRGLLLSVSAAILYSLETSVIKEKLSGIDPVKLTIFFYLVSPLVIPVMIFVRVVFKEGTVSGLSASSITPTEWFFIFFCLVAEVIADFFWIKAYNVGASVALVTSIMTSLPIFALVVNSFWCGELPSLRQFAGCCMIPIAIWLIGIETD